MKKHLSQMYVYFTGSRETKIRSIYTQDGKFYVKWGGEYIEVKNTYGYDNISDGWVTVEPY